MTIKHKDWTMEIAVTENETGNDMTVSMLTDLRIALFSAEYDYRAKGYKFCADFYRDLREALAIPETEAESNG